MSDKLIADIESFLTNAESDVEGFYKKLRALFDKLEPEASKAASEPVVSEADHPPLASETVVSGSVPAVAPDTTFLF